jgi:WD40 repeat protein
VVAPVKTTSGALDATGARVALGCRDGTVLVGRVEEPDSWTRLEGLSGAVSLLSFSPRQSAIVASDGGGMTLAWDIATGTALQILPHSVPLTDVVWLDEREWITLDGEGALFRWQVPAGRDRAEVVRIKTAPHDRCSRLEGTSSIVAIETFAWDVIDVRTAAARRVVPAGFDPSQLVRYVGRVIPSRNGRVVLIYWDGGDVFDSSSGALLYSFEHLLAAGAVDVSDDGSVVAIGSIYGRLLVRERTGGVRFRLEVTPDEIVAVDLSPNGDRVLFVDLNGGFGVLDARDGVLLMDSSDLPEGQ